MPTEWEFDQSRRNVPSWEEHPQLRALTEQIGVLQGQLSSALSELAAYKRQSEVASDKFRPILAQREADVSNLRSALTQRETDVSNLRSALAQRETDASNLRSAFAQREADNNNLRSILAQREAELTIIRAEHDTHLNRVSILRSQLKIPDRFENHFVQPTNEIHQLLTQAEVRSEQSKFFLTEAAVTACTTLRRLVTDPDYLRVNGVLSGDPNEYMRDFKVVTDDPDQFWKFVVAEYDLLTASGLSKQFGTNILIECSNVVKAIQEGKANPQSIGKSLRALRHQSCSLADRLQKQLEEEKSSRRTTTILRRILIGGVGAGVVGVVNTYAIGLPDFGSAFSNASLAFAGGLAGLFAELVITNG